MYKTEVGVFRKLFEHITKQTYKRHKHKIIESILQSSASQRLKHPFAEISIYARKIYTFNALQK